MTDTFLRTFNFRISVAIAAAVLVMGLAVMQDLIQYFVYAQSAFNISESLLFESFWIFFAPFSAGIIYGLKALNARFPEWKWLVSIAFTLFVSTLHLTLYSLTVFAISYLSGGHVFEFTDVLQHSIAEDLYICLLVYSTICIMILRFTPAGKEQAITPKINPASLSKIHITNGTNNILIETGDIIFITASSPYTCIHTARGKFLYPETLKALEEKLDPTQFLRVHKSSIVNVKGIASYKSRLNGDYDLTLENGELVRMSRNYTAKFRSLLS